MRGYVQTLERLVSIDKDSHIAVAEFQVIEEEMHHRTESLLEQQIRRFEKQQRKDEKVQRKLEMNLKQLVASPSGLRTVVSA
eukprot:7320628-Pyramimonas_sp.AAC.1